MVLETKPFNQEIKKGNLNPFNQSEIVICSFHFARTKEAYIKQIDWDLVVIDEAHHLRNVYKPTNRIANTIEAAVIHCPKLLLTATPLQNALLELYGLVSVIDDHAFGDLKNFKNQFSRLMDKREDLLTALERGSAQVEGKGAANQRVYHLLSEKFRLFEGVFGASDEVLGTIESGVDFEKRIAKIYQECRTEEEIQNAFDSLQKEMETQIDETMNITRQKLLENFDEEVHEKLKVNLRESKEYVSRYESWLWEITKYFLGPYADFSSDDHSFMLRENPFPHEKINSGPYRIGKNIEDANIYRVGHPLAQRIIDKCKSLSLPHQALKFLYSSTPKKISILEPFVNKEGWLSIINLTIDSFETEDQILFCGVSDDGTALDAEVCQRLFSLPADTGAISNLFSQAEARGLPDIVREQLDQIAHKQEIEIIQANAEHNAGFFDTEMGKLDKWAEDVKSSLEIELKELDKEIKFRKTEAKKILSLEEKVDAQRTIKEMEKNGILYG